MARIISASINLDKIDKSRIKTGKNGIGKYYDISIVLNDEPNTYGQDVAIKQAQTKEERESKEKEIYLGNGKTVWTNEAKTNATTQSNESQNEDLSNLPF